MANPFASSKQPSLFPMTFPNLKISKDEYHLFYNYERALFKILLGLQHEVVDAKLVIGFLLWLERGGYTSYPLGKTFINYLSLDAINEVVDEVLICIKFLQKKASNLMFEGSSNSYNISKLQCFLDRKRIHLDEIYHSSDLICDEVYCITHEVSAKAFDDILEQYRSPIRTPAMFPHRDFSFAHSVSGPVLAFQEAPSNGVANQDSIFMQAHQMAHQYQHQQMVACVPPVTEFRPSTFLGQNQAYTGHQTSQNNTRLLEQEPDEVVPPDDRTIFLTFSKGYPISADDVTQYFCGLFGDCIQSIHMQPVVPGSQPLFARMVVRDLSSVRAVIGNGPDGKSRYVINGKHVWARKFVPRIP
ncbi:uncharacterized protein LOC143603066 [Bidens hawaiensis]|uniref:uncharacterized protein LOC143603066 n=1 Tax=Bidens hawaiensis TaxID=980011 RepID=UPI0040499DBB